MSDSDPSIPPVRDRADLTVGPIAKTLLLFALPTLGSNVLQSLNGSVNAIWVGHILGENALAATSNANLVMFLMFAALFGFGMAATIMVGQNYGRRDLDEVRRIMGTAIGLFLGLSIVIAVLGWVYTPQLLHMLATPPQAEPLALAYLRVIFVAMPASFLTVLLMMGLRGTGDALTPLKWMAVSVVLDSGLNPVLMLGLGPFPRMGISGSATATAFAGYISLLGLLIHIYIRDLPVRLRGAELRYLIPDWSLAKVLAVKGFPMAMQMFVMSGSALVMIGLINREGVVVTAAYGVTQQLWAYIQMPAMAVGAAVSAMAAQNIGAGRWDRVARITRSGVIFSLLLTTSLVALLAVVDRYALGLFLAQNSPAMPIARHIQLIATWSFIMFGLTFVLFGTIRANGGVWPPLIILILSLIPFRIGFALLFRPTLGADAIWLSFPISSLVTMLLAIAYYRLGNWRSMHLLTPPSPIEAEQAASGSGEPAGRLQPSG
ncbi:MATE family efflux transporter [Sphingomonas paeninsulae]|uniref:MATE family efflux transporter n=1 Tax=Sphingomonas paeninsulae TaxID=2319844 RepID=A0A494TJ06_SPHPE|nr:MATE family efflux transporter [Sphingomonas paeninsulae]AYJ87474.1 MATE family efflux transporter [Sphingomonas paeninsulae]